MKTPPVYSRGQHLAAKILEVDPKAVVMGIQKGKGAPAFAKLCEVGTDAEIEVRVRECIAQDKPSIYINVGDKKEQAMLPLIASSRPIDQWPVTAWAMKVANSYMQLSFEEFVTLAATKKPADLPSYPGDNGDARVPVQIQNSVKLKMALALYAGALTKAVRKIGKEQAEKLAPPPRGSGDIAWEKYREQYRAMVDAHNEWTPELVKQYQTRILDGDRLGDPNKKYEGSKPLAMRPGTRAGTIFLSQSNTLKPVPDHPWNYEFRLGDDWAIFDGRGAFRQVSRLFGVDKTRTPAQVRAMFGDGVIRFSRRENKVVAAMMFRPKTIPVTTKRVLSYKRSSAMQMPFVGIDLGAAIPLSAAVIDPNGRMLKQWTAGRRLGPIAGVAELMPWQHEEKIDRRSFFVKHGRWPESCTAEEPRSCGVAPFAEIERRTVQLQKAISSEAMAALSAAERSGLLAVEDPEAILAEIGKMIGPIWATIEDRVRAAAADMKSGPKRTATITELLMEVDPNRTAEQASVVESGIPCHVIEGWIASARGWGETSDSRWISMAKERLSPRGLKMKLQEKRWELQATRFRAEYRKLALATEQLCQYVSNRLVDEVQKVCGDDFVIAIEKDIVGFVGAGARGGAYPERVGFGLMCKPSQREARQWFIAPLANALKKLATEKGLNVTEVPKERTSQRCPKCMHVDGKSRRTQDFFVCTKCSYEGNADLDVAAFNIAHIGLTGVKIERPIDAEIAGVARTRKPRKSMGTKSRSGIGIQPLGRAVARRPRIKRSL